MQGKEALGIRMFLFSTIIGQLVGLDAEYFFPPLAMGDNASSFFWDDSAFEIFYMINPTSISWSAVVKSIPTLIALVMFSLIHVPINIPAFAVSSNVDVDMNMELKAHR
jgi:SulP family sulfate permease